MLVVAFITAAMITVMSAFNGIDDLVKQLFANFDAPLTVVPVEGKYFADSLVTDKAVLEITGVKGLSRYIEEDAWLNYLDHNAVATIKGVDHSFTTLSPIHTMIYDGEFLLEDDVYSYAVVGLGVRSELYMPLYDYAPTVMHINAPIRGKKLSKHKENAFKRQSINVSGVFSVNAELDTKYALVPLKFAKELFGMQDDISGIEVFIDNDKDLFRIQKELQQRIPESLEIETRYDKNAIIYKTNASEKWATFLILLFILFIACFNIIASLTMLIIEKKKDIFTLSSMGFTARSIESIFVFEGILINFIGAVIGTSIGLLLCFGQQKYGFISMQGAMVEAYPISVKWLDIIGIFTTVITVGSLFSFALVRQLVRRFASNNMMRME